eukprot:CAMPEP_0201518204 /NCGR_PEP_ID=MMETSP0161_2-20130828/9111_1 /ASSEMBLY_ACC=CAM_ASM_000251 /TAXON_ID=180227 /ORGANISM="Neoparamoeba aestuarina, Strain SoJaBio B1-5/56/2" /LENGTH=135 /DNA_ID=CAMNT_0047915913 /DNA_START=279 /DNA_END=683 /DNA_ORIENTATION=-
MQNAQEQVRALGRMDVLVGVHGAGLGGMIALPPGSRVVEIMGRVESMNNHFRYLAQALGHQYRMVKVIGEELTNTDMEKLWDAIVQGDWEKRKNSRFHYFALIFSSDWSVFVGEVLLGFVGSVSVTLFVGEVLLG